MDDPDVIREVLMASDVPVDDIRIDGQDAALKQQLIGIPGNRSARIESGRGEVICTQQGRTLLEAEYYPSCQPRATL